MGNKELTGRPAVFSRCEVKIDGIDTLLAFKVTGHWPFCLGGKTRRGIIFI